ncbi:MAG: hypothetical protein V4857_12930 [Pseudomonadota bacterium]
MQTTYKKPANAVKLGAAMILAAALAGCGGGNNAPGELPGTITITGTAATVIAGSTNNAIGGAAIVATCARGYGTAMTAADGSFSVTVTNPGVAPCVLQVFKADNTTLRSVATGNGNFNITPMTELLVQYISAQISTVALPVSTGTINAPNLLTNNAGFVKLLGTPALLNNSIARVSEFAKTFPGPATPTLQVPSDFLTAQLVAKTPSNAGNAQNAFLEALRARNTITTAGALNGTTATEAIKDANLPANKVTTP